MIEQARLVGEGLALKRRIAKVQTELRDAQDRVMAAANLSPIVEDLDGGLVKLRRYRAAIGELGDCLDRALAVFSDFAEHRRALGLAGKEGDADG